MAFTKISSIIRKKVVQLLFLEWNPCFRILLPEKLSKRNAVQAITLVFQLSEPVHTGIEKTKRWSSDKSFKFVFKNLVIKVLRGMFFFISTQFRFLSIFIYFMLNTVEEYFNKELFIFNFISFHQRISIGKMVNSVEATKR